MAAARLISVAAQATAPKKDQKWMCPRSRGLVSTGGGGGSVVTLTGPTLRDRRFFASPRGASHPELRGAYAQLT
ncbi:hypothetical protein GCM10022222_64800 [Amycolatopsis ultiminotia]|uniref:Uncharacterized protein n=1 Tax=Amycolatopsis ultiminotia TaxID=543629 RepID=A0ABP6XU23_9PSEU